MLDFERIKDHEQVVLCHEPKSGLKAIIAIHNTTLGPALGGGVACALINQWMKPWKMFFAYQKE